MRPVTTLLRSSPQRLAEEDALGRLVLTRACMHTQHRRTGTEARPRVLPQSSSSSLSTRPLEACRHGGRPLLQPWQARLSALARLLLARCAVHPTHPPALTWQSCSGVG